MQNHRIPEMKNYQGYPTLFVEDSPFVILGGEIHNSSASDAAFMEKEVWPYLRGLGLNTVVAPVYWECLEPEEGTFDFSTVETLIKQAREEGVKLVLLWFGLWKNAESMYVPGWMKRDRETYFVCRKYNGDALPTISPFCVAAVEKDRQAFCRLMAYVKEADEQEQTVIMVQVENEIGLLGSDRDYCAEAEGLFNQPVPKSLASVRAAQSWSISNPNAASPVNDIHESAVMADKADNWQQQFGEDAGEYFMAWGFASAVERIASAGKEIYPLPMYVNAWLEQFPWRAGTYPSGGPVRKMSQVWKCMAPSIFTQAPDIYVPYVPLVMDEYAGKDNPLFIPEVRKDAVAASYAMYAVFGCHAIGFSPFGIEELQMDPEKIDKPPMSVMIALNIDPSAFDVEGSGAYLAAAYGIINQLLPLYYQYRDSSAVQAYVRKESRELGAVLSFENYDVQVNYSPKERKKPESAGVVIQTGPDEFVAAGMMSSLMFLGKQGSNEQVEILHMEEGMFADGEWQRGRILNGDEKMSITMKDMPAVYRIEVGRYR